MATMYCVKCRGKKNVDDSKVQRVTMKNGKPASKAQCPDCGTTMFKIGG
jgi:NAD-dependent SIR2 family protein deacetylase